MQFSASEECIYKDKTKSCRSAGRSKSDRQNLDCTVRHFGHDYGGGGRVEVKAGHVMSAGSYTGYLIVIVVSQILISAYTRRHIRSCSGSIIARQSPTPTISGHPSRAFFLRTSAPHPRHLPVNRGWG